MSRGARFRPQLLPPQGGELQRSYRSCVTCIIVSGCIILLISVIFGLTAFNIYKHRFGLTEHRYHSGDQVSLLQAAEDLVPLLCSAYVVQPLGQADFFLLPQEATLDLARRVNFTLDMTVSPHRNLFETRTHYLPANATVALRACRHPLSDVGQPVMDDVPAEFLVIVGDEDFEEWHKEFDDRLAKHRVPIPKNASCSNATPSLPHLTLTSTHPDNFHFVLYFHHRTHVRHDDTGDVTLTGNFSKNLLNVSGAVGRCNLTEESCRFPLSWGSHPDIVAEVDRYSQKADAPASFLTDCEERLVFWVPIFGALPVSLMLAMSLCCWCLLVKRRSVGSRYRTSRAGQSPVNSYGAVGQETDPLVEESAQSYRVSGDVEGRASIQD